MNRVWSTMIRARLESVLLLLIGLGAGGFSLSKGYPVLMHPKFQWLTLVGAGLALSMGAAGWRQGRRNGGAGIGVFMLLFAIALVGRPWSQGAASMAPALSDFGGLDDPNYPLTELKALERAVEKGEWPLDAGFSALGILKRLPEEESQYGAVTLMRSYMVCCAADAVAYGFRLEDDDLERFEEGDWVVVSGKLAPLPELDPVSPFRLGATTFSVVGPGHIIKPERIVSSRTLLPSLHGQLSSEQIASFAQALKTTGLWETLRGQGPFTVFAPINQVFRFTENGPPEDGADLRRWLSRHIVPGRYVEQDLFDTRTLSTLDNQELQVHSENGTPRVGGARILFSDMDARNGVVHIMYPGLESTP